MGGVAGFESWEWRGAFPENIEAAAVEIDAFACSYLWSYPSQSRAVVRLIWDRRYGIKSA